MNYLQRSHRNQIHPAPHVLCNFVVHDWHPIQSSQPTAVVDPTLVNVWYVQNEFLLAMAKQCGIIWLFLSDLGYKLTYKSCPNIWSLFGDFVKRHFLSENCCGCFCIGNFGKNWSTFLFQHLVTLLAKQKVFWGFGFLGSISIQAKRQNWSVEN